MRRRRVPRVAESGSRPGGGWGGGGWVSPPPNRWAPAAWCPPLVGPAPLCGPSMAGGGEESRQGSRPATRRPPTTPPFRAMLHTSRWGGGGAALRRGGGRAPTTTVHESARCAGDGTAPAPPPLPRRFRMCARPPLLLASTAVGVCGVAVGWRARPAAVGGACVACERGGQPAVACVGGGRLSGGVCARGASAGGCGGGGCRGGGGRSLFVRRPDLARLWL